MAAGSIVKNVVEYIVTQIVEDTKSVKVDIADSDVVPDLPNSKSEIAKVSFVPC